MCAVQASAQSTELVQMFEVAFSRRMCCSRVERVSTKPRLPSASTVSPTRRTGHLPHIFVAGRKEAAIRAAELQADTDRLALADDDVRAHLARRFDRTERHRLGVDDDQKRARRLAFRGDVGEIRDAAENVGILDDDAARLGVHRQRVDVQLRGQRRRRVRRSSPVNFAIVFASET